jgi:hypothetical protein
MCVSCVVLRKVGKTAPFKVDALLVVNEARACICLTLRAS